jgi:CxxC motif-containing protein
MEANTPMEKIIKKCKVCPIGCELTIYKNESAPSGYTVEGNSCGRGIEFGIKEVTEPSRILTGRVLLKNAPMKHLSVRTTGVIPKDKVDECLKIFNSTEVSAPIQKGDIIIKNILGLGVDVVAARRVK